MTRRVVFVLIAVLIGNGCGPKVAPVVTAVPPPVTDAQKLAWILQLEDERVARGPAAGQDLVVMLSDQGAHIRRRAALGLGRARIVEAVPVLAGLLATEPDPEVRQMFAFALGLIGSADAAPALIAALSAAEPLTQGRAAEALGMIGHKPAAGAIATMISGPINAGALNALAADDVGYPKEAAVEAVRLGLYALVRLQAHDELAGALLDSSGQPRSRWWPVAYAFQRVGDPRAAAPLTALLTGDGQVTRAFAARGLGTLKHQPAIAALQSVAADAAQPQAVRIQAVRALGAIGQPSAGETLLKIAIARGVDPTLQMEAVVALGQIKHGPAVDALLELVSAPWPALRSASLLALARIDPDTFISAISALDEDPHWSVRAALATALAEIGAERSDTRLMAMLQDRDQRVLPAVLTALAATASPSAPAALTNRLTNEDPVVRMAAANGLARLKAKDGVPAVVAALAASQADGTYVARAALLNALTTLDPAQARPALNAALGDKDWAIRLRAAELLRGLDASPAAAGPEPLVAGDGGAAAPQPITPAPAPPVPELSDLDALLSPAFTPTAYIDTEAGMIQIELSVVDAPRTVANFTALAKRGYFTNLPWHRVVADFVVQGGDPRGDGEGGPGYTIRDEINQRPYMRGTVGMALDWADTGGSQFFITHSPQPHLDGRYTVFGQVVTGMDVVDKLRQWDIIRSVRIWDGVAWIGSDAP
jgi:cyclophilin family peptidyl-prolyl cis-trans isomerase/HEAT repeat protein